MRLFVPLLSSWKCVSKLAFQQIQWWKSGWVILGPRWVFSVYSFRINKPNNYIIYLLHLSLQHKWEATMSCSNLPSRIQFTLILQTPESLVGVMGKKGIKFQLSSHWIDKEKSGFILAVVLGESYLQKCW